MYALYPVFPRGGGVRTPPNGADFGVDGSTLERREIDDCTDSIISVRFLLFIHHTAYFGE
jgi:hypothetical protein